MVLVKGVLAWIDTECELEFICLFHLDQTVLPRRHGVAEYVAQLFGERCHRYLHTRIR